MKLQSLYTANVAAGVAAERIVDVHRQIAYDGSWPIVARCCYLVSSATRKDAFDLRAWLLPDIVRVSVRVLYCDCDQRVGICKKYFGCNTRVPIWTR